LAADKFDLGAEFSGDLGFGSLEEGVGAPLVGRQDPGASLGAKLRRATAGHAEAEHENLHALKVQGTCFSQPFSFNALAQFQR
jgi:hypothetical protein